MTQQTLTVINDADKVNELVRQVAPSIQKANPNFNLHREIGFIVSLMEKNGKLKQCTAESAMECLHTIAEMGWTLNPQRQHCTLVPYSDKATLQPMYLGFVNLMGRELNITRIGADVVRRSDQIKMVKGTDGYVVHEPSLENRGGILGAYGYIIFPDGSKHVEWMDITELKKVASKAKSQQTWREWTDEMYKKSVTRRMSKMLIELQPSAKLEKAIEADNEHFDMSKPLYTPPEPEESEQPQPKEQGNEPQS